MSNGRLTVFYTGVTNDLSRRNFEHQNKLNPKSFTARYNINRLLYFEHYTNPEEAIRREKQIKGWTREKKLNLVQSINPKMEDLFELRRDSSLRSE